MKTILAADDSPSIRQMVAFTLSQAGYQVVEAIDGQDALDQLSRLPVDLLITDLNMPRLSGLDLIRQVRSQPTYRHMPILMLTTESQPDQKIAAKTAGATGWIVKPFTREQMLAVVPRVLR